ncbi:peptidoglycan-binding protein, partial [Microcoleus sp. herbarium5]
MVLEFNRNLRSKTLQHNHTHCTAHIGFTAEEIEQFSWGTRGFFEPMPANGDGYECYGDNCYGRP